MTERLDLIGRVALVTGGSRGLGRAIVHAYARAGADVVIASRKMANCQEVAAEVVELGRRALPYSCHVGQWDELPGLVDAAYETFGQLDILVNNAGMSPLYDHVGHVSEQLWDSVVAVNLKGPFRLSALVGARMVEAGRGSIINISSVGSIRPGPGIVPYAAAKAGLNAMTVGLAHTFGPQVRVNCIMPGAFRTDVTSAWDQAAFDAAAERTALQRMGEPDEIVGAALYLASDLSSYTTGTIVTVDGGIR